MKRILDYLNYYIFKLRKKVIILLTFDKQKKISIQSTYNDWFSKPDRLNDENGLPEDKYCYLSNIIIYDLISKHDINSSYLGLKKYIKNHISHRFLGNTVFDDRVTEIINYINESNHSYDSYHHLGYFEVFDRKSKIDYYEVNIKNFSSTFFAIEIVVFFNNTFKNELQDIIQKDIVDEKGQLSKYYFRSKNRVVKHTTVSRKFSSDYKYDIIKCRIDNEKNILLKHVNQYLKLELYNRSIFSPSTNVFITNLTYDDDIKNFWRSLGIDSFGYNGEFIDDSCKVFYYPCISRINLFDISIILNADKYKSLHKNGFNSVEHFQHSSKHISEDYFRVQILDKLIEKYNTEFSKYRNKNIIGLKYRHILKLSRNFTKTFSFLQSINNEVDWDNVRINIGDTNLYKNVKLQRKVITGEKYKDSAVFRLNELINNLELLNKKIDTEFAIATKSREYRRAIYNAIYKYMTLFISLLMLILTSLTLAILINEEFKNNILELINNLKNFIDEVKFLVSKQ